MGIIDKLSPEIQQYIINCFVEGEMSANEIMAEVNKMHGGKRRFGNDVIHKVLGEDSMQYMEQRRKNIAKRKKEREDKRATIIKCLREYRITQGNVKEIFRKIAEKTGIQAEIVEEIIRELMPNAKKPQAKKLRENKTTDDEWER